MKSCNVVVVLDFAFLTKQILLAEVLRKQIARCYTKLAARQRHFSVCIASRLLCFICPAKLARYVGRKLVRDNGYKWSFCSTVLL